MFKAVITHLQIFGIGFSFGIVGPCFLTCAPILVTYVVGTKRRPGQVFADVSIFSSGRLVSYAILGALAGLSGGLIKSLTGPSVEGIFRPLAGIVSILLGILVIILKRNDTCACPNRKDRFYNFGGLLALGFIVGASPCAPLIALLFEIALMSKTALEGASYALSFGLGTFLSGLLIAGIFSSVLTGFAARMLKSKSANLVFRVVCGVILILLGAGLVLS